MTKKLFVVEIATEIVVFAEDKKDAEKIAAEARRDLSNSDFGFEAALFMCMPCDWDANCQPFGSIDGKTIEQLVQQGAAPEYVKLMESFKEKKK